jgi:hypothetical protein
VVKIRSGQGEGEVTEEGESGEEEDREGEEEVGNLSPVVLSQEAHIPMLPLQGRVHEQHSAFT